jgi:hypothetical protein
VRCLAVAGALFFGVKKTRIVVLAFVFMAENNQSGDVTDKISPLNLENLNVLVEGRRFPQAAKLSNIRLRRFRYRKSSETRW